MLLLAAPLLHAGLFLETAALKGFVELRAHLLCSALRFEQSLRHDGAKRRLVIDKEEMGQFRHGCQYFDSLTAKRQKEGIRILWMRPIRVCVTG